MLCFFFQEDEPAVKPGVEALGALIFVGAGTADKDMAAGQTVATTPETSEKVSSRISFIFFFQNSFKIFITHRSPSPL